MIYLRITTKYFRILSDGPKAKCVSILESAQERRKKPARVYAKVELTTCVLAICSVSTSFLSLSLSGFSEKNSHTQHL